MKEIERKACELIVKTSRKELAKQLGIDFRTLISRLDVGGWKKIEEEVINELYDKLIDKK